MPYSQNELPVSQLLPSVGAICRLVIAAVFLHKFAVAAKYAVALLFSVAPKVDIGLF